MPIAEPNYWAKLWSQYKNYSITVEGENGGYKEQEKIGSPHHALFFPNTIAERWIYMKKKANKGKCERVYKKRSKEKDGEDVDGIEMAQKHTYPHIFVLIMVFYSKV